MGKIIPGYESAAENCCQVEYEDEGPKFGVRAQVSGGVMGSRLGWLKIGDSIMLFDTKEQAQVAANKANSIKRSSNSNVVFRYWVEEFDYQGY